MIIYSVILIVHILSSVVWLGAFPVEVVLRKFILSNKSKTGERKLISLWLKIVNLAGMIGTTGIVITGIFMSIYLGYGFFRFDAAGNHWLYAKQVLMAILLMLTGFSIIPSAVKIRKQLGEDMENTQSLADELYYNVKKLGRAVLVSNILVLINFLLAITHRFVY